MWYYAHNKQKCGPVPLDEMYRLLAIGTLQPTDMVLREGSMTWQPLGSVKEAFQPTATTSRRRKQAARISPKTWKIFGVTAGVTCLLGLVAFLVVWLSSGNTDANPQSAPQAPSAQKEKKTPEVHLGLITSSADEERISEAVGLVCCGGTIRAGFDFQTDSVKSSGTCFRVSLRGHLLTNEHVVGRIWELQNEEGEKAILRRLRDERGIDVQPRVWVFLRGKKFDAQILHVDKKNDLAVLKVDLVGGSYFGLSGADRHPRGKNVVACGFPAAARTAISNEEFEVRLRQEEQPQKAVEDHFQPRDFDYVLTKGAISRVVTEVENRAWIQHNAQLNPGNSGGPLLTEDGLVVGINTLRVGTDDAQGIFFSLSLGQLKDEINHLAPGVVWK